MKEALKLALEALDNLMYWDNGKPDYDEAREAITAIKAALAQPTSGDFALGYAEGFNDACKPKPAQEPVAWSSYEYDGIHHKPVAWMDSDGNVSDNNDHKCFPIPLYTITHPTPPQRKPLTDEKIEAIAARTLFPVDFARAIEAAHGIKENT